MICHWVPPVSPGLTPPKIRGLSRTEMSALPLIDSEAINNLRALGSDDDDSFLREIVALFLEDTPKRFEELRTSKLAGVLDGVARAAHSVKGSASNLGAMRVRAVAEKLEYAAKQNGLDGLEALQAELESEFAEAQVELRKLLA